MNEPKITRVHVTVMLVSADGRAIDRSVTFDMRDGDSTMAIVHEAGMKATWLVLDRMAGIDNRRERR